MEAIKHALEKSLGKATNEQPWLNSLGMKFVPVAAAQVFFSMWDTRVEDFRKKVEPIRTSAS
jgi:hypothetical protein